MGIAHQKDRRLRRIALLCIPVAATAVATAGCGGGGGTNRAATPGTATRQPSSSAPYGGTGPTGAAGSPSGAPASATTVTVRGTSLGRILTDVHGRTVYLFEKDKGTASTCTGACAAVWPPVTTSGAPAASGGAQASLLGTTMRADGTRQVTYASHPLYYFRQDTAPGEVRGEGVKAFGAAWYVLAPNGKKIDRD